MCVHVMHVVSLYAVDLCLVCPNFYSFVGAFAEVLALIKQPKLLITFLVIYFVYLQKLRIFAKLNK